MTPVALAIVSLIAAVAIWVAVTENENPTKDQELPFSIPIEAVGVPDGLAVYSMAPDAVVVTARGTDETLEKLTAANFRATVNMTGIRDAQSTQNVVVEVVGIDEDDASVVEVSSRFTRVVLETKTSKTVPVQVNRLGSLAQGFTIASTTTDPTEVTVVGPASSVNLVTHADADVNLTAVRSNIDLDYELTPRDAGGSIQPSVRVEPATARVKMAVQQLESPQIVPVEVQIQGTAAPGYNVTSIRPDPWNVEVRGSLETLQSLDSMLTEPVDVSGITQTVTRTVALQVPLGVQIDRPNVSVEIQVEPAPGSRAITVAPVVTNVPSGLNAVIQTTFVTVRVSGAAPLINNLTASDIQATIDASGLNEGTHSLDVKVSVPSDVKVDAVEPQQAVIALRP
jgi:YbbR domain-containing protein